MIVAICSERSATEKSPPRKIAKLRQNATCFPHEIN
jgi:hypothetical protein